MQLTLPRDGRYVHVMRTLAQCVLTELDAPQEAVDDIQVALTEACANAVRHAVGSSEYTVKFRVGSEGCEVEIVDLGPGFEAQRRARVVPEAETGRGLTLMRALVDDLQFIRSRDRTRVRLVKRWDGLDLSLGVAAEGSQQR